MSTFWSQYGKTIVAVAGVALTVLASYYGATPWWPVITAAATAAGVHFAPATAASGTVLPPGDAGAGLS